MTGSTKGYLNTIRLGVAHFTCHAAHNRRSKKHHSYQCVPHVNRQTKNFEVNILGYRYEKTTGEIEVFIITIIVIMLQEG